jgi:hypothetical protein
MRCTHTLYSCTVLIRCTHTLYSCTVCSYTVCILMHYTHTTLYSFSRYTSLQHTHHFNRRSLEGSVVMRIVLMLYSYCMILLLDSYCTHTHVAHTVLMLYWYTVLIHCTGTLYSYTVLIYYTPTLYSYTILIHCTHTLCSQCAPTVLQVYSHWPYTVLILYTWCSLYCTRAVLPLLLLYSYCTHTLYSYTVLIHCARIHCTHALHVYPVLIHCTHTLESYCTHALVLCSFPMYASHHHAHHYS